MDEEDDVDEDEEDEDDDEEDDNVYSLSSRGENATSNVEQYIRRLSLMS